jgi:hypothetical protein
VSRLILGYYGLTPLFWLLDWMYGANLRAVALQDATEWRALYYLLCIACGAALWLRPRWSGLVALVECSVNLLLLCLGVLLPYWRLADQITADRLVANPYTPELVINFAVAGAVWLVAFYGQFGARSSSTLGLSWRPRE